MKGTNVGKDDINPDFSEEQSRKAQQIKGQQSGQEGGQFNPRWSENLDTLHIYF